MRDDRYLGVICHHGIKGMKWGVRRSPEQLGHAPKGKKAVAKSGEDVTIDRGFYRSEKGFAVHPNKLSKFCLAPNGKHSDQFFKIGYKEGDAARLFRDIEEGYDESRKIQEDTLANGKEKFSIPMELGVTEKRRFRTVWREDGPDDMSRFVTAYIDRRLKED